MDFESKSQWALAWWRDEGRAVLMTRVTPVGAQAAFSFNCVIATPFFFSPGELPFLPHHSSLEQRQMIGFFEIWMYPAPLWMFYVQLAHFHPHTAFWAPGSYSLYFADEETRAAEARWLALVTHSQHQSQSELTPSVYRGCPEATSCWQPQ